MMGMTTEQLADARQQRNDDFNAGREARRQGEPRSWDHSLHWLDGWIDMAEEQAADDLAA